MIFFVESGKEMRVEGSERVINKEVQNEVNEKGEKGERITRNIKSRKKI